MSRSTYSMYSQLRSMVNDARAEMLSHVPTEVGNHLTAARKEFLAAVRAAVDEEIKWTDRRWEMAKERKAERKARAAGPKPGSEATTPPPAGAASQA